MSDTPTPNADAPDSDGNVDIKALREAAKTGKTAAAENDKLRRELAFAKAGIDTDSKLGSMLFKTWEGDLDDVAAIKAEWAELNPAQAPAPTGPPETAPTPPGFQDPAQQQQHREMVAGSGTPAGEAGNPGIHPKEKALDILYGQGSSRAMPLEDRQEAALNEVFSAYFQGDTRVMVDQSSHRQAAMQAAAEDGITPS